MQEWISQHNQNVLSQKVFVIKIVENTVMEKKLWERFMKNNEKGQINHSLE